MDFSALDQRGRANAIKLAAFEANTEPEGLEGRRFGYLFCDVQADDLPTSTAPYNDSLVRADAARQGADFFVNQLQVPVIVGPSASVDAINVWQEIVQSTPTMLFSPVATSLVLSTLEAGPFSDERPGMLWRVPPPDSVLARGMGRDLIQRDVHDIVFVGVRGYGTAFADAITATLAAEDPGTDYQTWLIEYDDQNDNEFVRAVSDATTEHPDAEEIVFVSSDSAEMVRFIGLANTNSTYAGKRIFFSGAGATGQFLSAAPQVLEEGRPGSTDEWLGEMAPGTGDFRVRSIRYASPAAGPGSRYSAFLDRYRSQGFEGDPALMVFTSHSYDASWMSIYAATWSLLREQEVTGIGMARGLRKMSSGADVDLGALGWSTVRAQFAAGHSVDVAGASSRLDYDLETEENTSAGYDVVGYVPKEEGPGWTFTILGGVPEP
jgi:ABC-type branched-subunit amino acid transport system substrate-binding protein